jgi:phosphotransferase system HPr-like phosphotransfer protein
MKMSKYKIKLNTFDKVQSFVKIMLNIEFDSIIRSEDRKYAVDAKSIMGLYSLDLAKDLILEINGEVEGFVDKLASANICVVAIND